MAIMTLRKESVDKEEEVWSTVAKDNDDMYTSLTGKGRVLNQSSTPSIPWAVPIKRRVI